MVDWFDHGDFNERHRKFGDVRSTTLTYDEDGLGLRVLHSPHTPHKPREELIEVWRRERAEGRAGPGLFCTLLTQHPWSFQRFTFIARDVVAKYPFRGGWVRDVIPYAEATVVLRLDPAKRAWAKVLKCDPEDLPALIRGLIRNLSHEACHDLNAHLSGTKSLHRALTELDKIADGRPDLDAVTTARELLLFVESYSGEPAEMFRLWRLDGITQKEIAAMFGLSEDQVQRRLSDFQKELEKRLDEFRSGRAGFLVRRR